LDALVVPTTTLFKVSYEYKSQHISGLKGTTFITYKKVYLPFLPTKKPTKPLKGGTSRGNYSFIASTENSTHNNNKKKSNDI
jgi:hypothetical protein